MKFLLVLVLSGLAFGAKAPLKSAEESIVENLLRQSCRKEWDSEVRVEIENVFTRDTVGKNASIFSIFPRPALGVVNFELAWQDKGKMYRTIGSAVIRVFANVAVAQELLRTGDSLDQAKIQYEERELTKLTQTGYFLSPESLEGKVARGYIRPGTVLGVQNVETPAPIVQGQMLDLIHGTANVRITAKVKALEKGKVGSWIRVENPQSKKVLRAKVTAPGEVSLR